MKKREKKALQPLDAVRYRRRCLRDKADIRSFFLRLIFLTLFVYVLFFRVFGLSMVPDDDMKPKLSGGDLVLFYRLQKDYKFGDVIVFRKDSERYVSRVIAVSGDTVQVTQEGAVIVNGNTLIEDNIFYATKPYESGIEFPMTLGQDELFVLSDYREGARDSRYFGAVKLSEAEGQVMAAIRRSNL